MSNAGAYNETRGPVRKWALKAQKGQSDGQSGVRRAGESDFSCLIESHIGRLVLVTAPTASPITPDCQIS